MPVNLLNRIMLVLRAAIIVIVVGWILNVPGRLQMAGSACAIAAIACEIMRGREQARLTPREIVPSS
jgi:hypothetical protein